MKTQFTQKKTERRATLKISLAVFASSIAAGATVFGAVQNFVYTRKEGRLLERRVDDVEQHYREDVKQVRDKLESILERLK